ncbi:MAG: hypothetical protein Q8N23_00865 [Archangium sp.]|nr:hypothetical protein [Archangium sp.]MDP3151186.1 hypothetical protein [Archangium sp.]MDP3570173.1 hypothetical protein [Archangium sp.]
MILRALLVFAVVTGFLTACGSPKPLTEKEICGEQGCDACVGPACTATDGGTP